MTVFGEEGDLPKGNHVFLEFYCVDPTCDCRRVILNVLSEKHSKYLATINYSFEPPPSGDVVEEQTFLDPLNPQSAYSAKLLHPFESTLLLDPYIPCPCGSGKKFKWCCRAKVVSSH